MDLTFGLPSFEYMAEKIAAFQSDETSDFFSDSLYLFYPQFDRKRMASLDQPERVNYVCSELSSVYQNELPLLQEKCISYQNEWDRHRPVIQSTFENLFSIDLKGILNDMTANITLNPVCPRFLVSHSFDIFYLNSPAGALGLSLHEIVHFLWFQIWQKLFLDNPAEYESPNLKWVFSEMVVDLFLNHPCLRPLNPYLTKGNGTIYEYFDRMTIGGQPALPQMKQLYLSNSISEFMEKGYSLCLQHESEIRSAMR